MNPKSNRKKILFTIILFGLVSTILSPIGDVLAEGMIENLKGVFGNYYKLPVIFFSALLTGLLYYATELRNTDKQEKENPELKRRNVFILGTVYSGKSVLTYSIINHLANNIGSVYPPKKDYSKFSKLINNIKKGKLPNASPVGGVIKIKMNFRPQNTSLYGKMELTLYDFSGEYFSEIISNKCSINRYAGDSSENLEKIVFAENSKIIIVTDRSQAEDIDSELPDFFRKIETKIDEELKNKILVLINKWDLSVTDSDEYGFENFYRRDNTEEKIKKYLPLTSKYCFENNIEIIPLSCGDVIEDKTEYYNSRINFDSMSIRPVIDWIQDKMENKENDSEQRLKRS